MFKLFCKNPKNSNDGDGADSSKAWDPRKIVRGWVDALSENLDTTDDNFSQGHFDDVEDQSTEELTTERLQLATKEAANLLFEIKDVRDELNIISTVAKYQQKVQSAMKRHANDDTCASCQTSKDSAEDLTANYVCDDITELDKVAGQIQNSVSHL